MNAATMCSSIVRLGAWFATALLAAASADAVTEFVENLGWLGGSARDGHQETVVPVLLIGVAAALAVAAYVALARISGGDLSMLRSRGIRSQILGATCALIGSALCALVMEGYETRLGGLSPFDTQSVLVSHAPALLAAFAIIGVAIQSAMRELLSAAERAGDLAARTFVRFVRKLLRAPAGPGVSHARLITARVLHRSNPGEGAGSALRAPPPGATFRPAIA